MITPVRPPYLLRKFYSRFTWNIPEKEKTVYLSFDDGPITGVTEFVLDTLKHYSVPATFFSIGENVKKHPEIYQHILNDGHVVGNHTFNHLNGWKTSNEEYFQNIHQAAELISSDLFRPPYGRITKFQADHILQKYKIIMWDVLSYDYDKNVSKEKCLENVLKNTRPGSIIVFHDSMKAQKNMEYALPRAIEELQRSGYDFKKITSNLLP